MKLLILQESDWFKRYPHQQHHLAEMMSMRGHEVRALDYPISWRSEKTKGLYSKRTVFNNVNKIHENAKVKVIRPGFVRIPLFDYVSVVFSHDNELNRQFREFQPDVVIGFGILNSWLASRVLKKTNVPFIFYWIDLLHLLIPNKIFRRLGIKIEQKALQKSDRVLTINEKLQELVIRLGADKEKVALLKAGIDIAKFNPDIKGQALRQQYGINENDTVLFFMGFLYQFAGLKEVALRLSGLKDEHLKLLIVGEGDAYLDLQQIRVKYHLESTMILTGKKSYQEIPGLIAASDICLLPSYPWEPIMQDIVPIKLYEYMAMKKPVISTKLPGVMREFGSDNGMIFVEKPDDIVNKALELISSGSLDDLGAKARKFAERNSWDKITDEFENILHEEIKKKK